MQSAIRWKWTELTIYILLWGMLLFSPIIVASQDFEFNKLFFKTWIRILPFLLIFLINNFFLVPNLFFKGHTRQYFLVTLLIVGLIVFLDFHFRTLIDNTFFGIHENRRMKMSHPKMIPFHRMKELMYINNFVISILVVGFNTALKLTGKWLADEQRRKELEKENIASKLAFLRYQISPHFFMNTLNNIHALIDLNTGHAKDSIIRLSMLMRYLLYDSDGEFTLLSKEIDFIRSYIDLMKLRLTTEIDIKFEVSKSVNDFKIPPLLLISFIENAYKHGISYKEASFIHIKIAIEESRFIFSIVNSIHTKGSAKDPLSGIGLQNTRKRLELIYSNKFELDIKESEKEYEVYLILPL